MARTEPVIVIPGCAALRTSGHLVATDKCPLSVVKRTSQLDSVVSAFNQADIIKLPANFRFLVNSRLIQCHWFYLCD